MEIVSETFEFGSDCEETADGEVVLNLIDMMNDEFYECVFSSSIILFVQWNEALIVKF